MTNGCRKLCFAVVDLFNAAHMRTVCQQHRRISHYYHTDQTFYHLRCLRCEMCRLLAFRANSVALIFECKPFFTTLCLLTIGVVKLFTSFNLCIIRRINKEGFFSNLCHKAERKGLSDRERTIIMCHECATLEISLVLVSSFSAVNTFNRLINEDAKLTLHSHSTLANGTANILENFSMPRQQQQQQQQ
ncbi:hypothetical protein T02_10628 [Trichinella nativa]|uniref:Uncharacterized protein n=1 Tax=Trichinella nativa TaxID=6335 RepID=A0A0V1LSU4_9BILA|nr:hypothetical protein T02_10628 [Trichinella nativa]